MVITFDTTEVLAALQAELSLAIVDGLHAGAVLVAEDAARLHPYKDRTGDLSASIHAEPATLSSSGRASVNVVASKRYGSFVNDGTKNEDGSQRTRPYPYLVPAYERRLSGVVASVEAAMVQGANRAFA